MAAPIDKSPVSSIISKYSDIDEGSDDEGVAGEPNELRVVVSAARNLAAADAGFFSATKSSDPYVTLAYRGRVKKTAVAKRTLNPTFGEKFVFLLSDRAAKGERLDANVGNTDELVVTVKDQDPLSSDDNLGTVKLDVSNLTTSYTGKWFDLKGKINGISFFTESEASGAVYVKAKAIRNPARVRKWQPDKPLSPAAAKYLVAIVMGIFWLISFIIALTNQFLSAVFESCAAFALTILVRSMTGIRFKINRLSIRFGSGEGAPTEIVMSGLKIYNPAGGFSSPYMINIVRVDLHFHIGSLLRARQWIKFLYSNDSEKADKVPPPKAAFQIDLFHMDGVTLFTEKNTSPLVDADDMILNIKGYSGKPSPEKDNEDDDQGNEEIEANNDESQITEEEEEGKPKEKRKNLPVAAHNVPMLFRMRNFQLTDVNLYPEDVISDVLGDSDGVGDVMKQKPVEIDSVIAVYDDFHDEKDMLWLGEVIGVIIHKTLPKLPVRALAVAAWAASSSKFSGDFSDFRDHVMMNTIFLHHGKGGSSLHAALNEGDKKKKN